MRNLKKVLSLALALVMLLGMMMVGAGAATTTSADLSEANQEAIAVLKATKVMTNKRYGDPVTRAEAAKMVLTIYNPTLAKGVKNTKNSVYFTDVKNHWAAGYIDLCFSEGIVSGRTKNVFDPNGTVTGYELGKMILKAMGSEKKYTGSTWTSKVMKDVTDLGLSANTKIGSNWDKALTRVQTAQLVFNGMIKSISGSNGYVLNKSDGTRVEAYANTVFSTMNDAILMKLASGSAGDSWVVAPSTASDALINNFPTLVNTPAKADAFGRTSNVWTMDGKTIYSAAAGAAKIYTAPVTASQIYNDLGLTAASVTADTNIDGISGNFTLTKADTTSRIGAVGATIEVYKTGANVSISVVTNYLAQVTKVNAAKAATATADAVPANVEATVYGAGAALTGKTFRTESFAKDEYVVVTVKKTATADGSDWTIESMEAADSVDGVMTSYNTSSITVDGAAYLMAGTYAGHAKYVAPADIGFKDTYTYYMKDGVVLGAVKKSETAVPSDFVYVIGIQAQAGAADLLGTTGDRVVADVVFTDGTRKVVDLALYKKADGNNYYKGFGAYTTNFEETTGGIKETQVATVSKEDGAIGNWFAYTVDKDGKYTLASVNDAPVSAFAALDTTGANLAANQPGTIGGKYTNGATKIAAIDSDSDKYTMTVATGLIQKDIRSGKALITFAPGSNVITAIYTVKDNLTVAAVNNTYAYAIQQGQTVATGTEWVFAIEGKLETKVVKTGETVAAGGIYTLAEQTNGSVVPTAVTSTYKTNSVKATVVDAGYVISDAVYLVDGNTKVFNVTANAENRGGVDVVEKDDYIVVVHDNQSPKKALAIYISDAPTAKGATLTLDKTTATLVKTGTAPSTTVAATFNDNTSGLSASSYKWTMAGTGKVTLTNDATATVTATWAGKGTETLTCTVTLSNGATLTKTVTVKCAEPTVTLTAHGNPVTSTGTATWTASVDLDGCGLTVKNIKWTSATTASATVDAGDTATSTSTTVTGVAQGTSDITCTVTLSNNETITATETVTVPNA